jgi:hypothetical protein
MVVHLTLMKVSSRIKNTLLLFPIYMELTETPAYCSEEEFLTHLTQELDKRVADLLIEIDDKNREFCTPCFNDVMGRLDYLLPNSTELKNFSIGRIRTVHMNNVIIESVSFQGVS